MFSMNVPNCKLDNIYAVIRPLYIFSRVFGFFPFTVNIDLKGKNQIYFTLTDFIVFAVHITVYGLIAYLNVLYNYMAYPNASPLLIFGTRTVLILGVTSGIGCIIADLFNRYRIFNIFCMCQEFDVQMRVLGSTLNYKRNKQCMYIYMFGWLTICILYNSIALWIYIGQYSAYSLVIIFGSYSTLNIVFVIILSIYTFFLFSIRTRYSLINENLSQLSIDEKGIKIIKPSKDDTIDNLMKLADLHDMLNDIMDIVNSCYSIQVMVAFGLSFSYMVFCLFSGYRGWIMRAADNNAQFSVAIVLMMWTTFYNFFVTTVIWAGHSTRNRVWNYYIEGMYYGKFTAVLLHRSINKCRNTEIVERLMTFSLQVNHRIPDANCKLFSYDWTLFYSIIAATSTYLIILIQFDTSGYVPGMENLTSQPK